MNNEENKFRIFFKNEFTWAATILMAGWTCVHWIILPLNTIQIQIAGLTKDISDIKAYDSRITTNANDILTLQGQVKNLIERNQ